MIVLALVKLRLVSVVDRLRAMELACNRLLNDCDDAVDETEKTTNGGSNECRER